MILVTRWTVRSVFYLHSPSRFFFIANDRFFFPFGDLFRRTPWWRSKRRRCRWLSRTSKLRSDCVRAKTPASLRPSKTRSKGAWVTSNEKKYKHYLWHQGLIWWQVWTVSCSGTAPGSAWEGGLWYGSRVLQRGLQEVGKQTRKWLLRFRVIPRATR